MLEELQLREIEEAAEALKKGGVVLFPTDTVYGIGAKWDNLGAIERIRQIKGSRQDFPVLISSREQLHLFAKTPSKVIHLINRFWPGALTIVLEGKRKHQKIGVRMPDSEVVRNLIEKAGFPIVGTSANSHGKKAPQTYTELEPRLIQMADYVIKGECEKGQESTVVDATVFPIKILREGAIKISGIKN